jgi:hypothetical protein
MYFSFSILSASKIHTQHPPIQHEKENYQNMNLKETKCDKYFDVIIFLLQTSNPSAVVDCYQFDVSQFFLSIHSLFFMSEMIV